MGRRDATDAEKRFLADSGVWAQKPSRATLLSVQAACSLLQRTSAPAAKIAAVQALRQAHALSPAELKQLPRIVPVQHGHALTSSKQFGGTNASLSDDDGGSDIGGEDDVSDEDNEDSDIDAPLAAITDRKDPAAAAMQSPAGSSAKARAHVKGASPGFGPPRAGRASPRHQSGSKDPRSRISLLWHQRASEVCSEAASCFAMQSYWQFSLQLDNAWHRLSLALHMYRWSLILGICRSLLWCPPHACIR